MRFSWINVPPVARLTTIISLFIPLLMVGSATLSRAETLIRSGGSTTVLPVVSNAVEAFTRTHPDVRITVSAGGSGVGIQGVGSGNLDIGLASREMTDRELQKFNDRKLTVHVVGRDAVACVISSEVYDAGVKTLSRDQIRRIYEGKIRNWNEVGGPDRPIVVIDKERHRGTRHVFMHYVFGDPKAVARGARLVTGSNNEEQAKIAQSDAAIGMLSFAWMNDDVRGVGLDIEGRVVRPTPENAASGAWPITRNLNLITASGAAPGTEQLIRFLKSPEGQAIVKAAHYLPVHMEEGSRIAQNN